MLPIGSTYHRTCLHRLIATSAVALVTVCALAPCAGAARASELVIDGAGDGHGVGMSQEGALGYALHGAGYREILAHYFTGTSIGQAPAGAQVKVLVSGKVKRVPLETYVRGVVAAEMPSSWPAAALQAQAVASRTYALTAHAGGSRFDVYADTRSQVYLGVAAYTPQSDAAVAATAGAVVTYEGHPVITNFFASSGGQTENVENAFLGAAPEPWLRGVPDPYDQGPLHRWSMTLTFTAAAARLRGLVKGAFEGVEVLRRGVSPRIVSADVLGTGGPTAVSGPELAARLGLYATWASFSVLSRGRLTPEPDRSGQRPPSTASAPPAPSTVPTASVRAAPAAGPQGGASAPQAAGSSPTGGVAAS